MSIAFNSATAANIEVLRKSNENFLTTQKRVATGKKVFSAADDATRYRMSETMLGRSRALSSLNNNISLALKTLEATDNTLKNMVSLVEQAQNIVRSAQADGAAGVYGIQSNQKISATTKITGAAVGQVLSITAENGQNFTYTVASVNDTWGQVVDALNGANIGVVAEFVPGTTAGTENIRFRSTNGAGFRFDGRSAQEIMDDLANASMVAPGGTTTMTSAAQAQNLFANGTAAATATETGFTVSFGGAVVGSKTGILTTTAIAANSLMVFKDGNGQTRTLNYTAATTVATLINDINAMGAGVKAELHNNGAGTTNVLRLRNTSGGNMEVLAATGAFASTGTIGIVPAAGTATGYATPLSSNNVQRLLYGQQFDNLIANINTQITNNPVQTGRNLLAGANMGVVMDEFGGTPIAITGVQLAGTGSTNNALGFTTTTQGSTWANDTNLQNAATAATNALTQLRNIQAQLSTYNTYMKSRYDINESYMKELAASGNELVAADVAEESANLTALQTQQQFAIQAFSMGSSQSQALLRLLG